MTTTRILRRIAPLILSLILLPVNLQAGGAEVAKVESFEGPVQAKRGANQEFEPVAVGMSFQEKDYINTKRRGRASLLFTDGVLLRLAENTTLQFQATKAQNSGETIEVTEGKTYLFSREPKHYPLISTPAVSTAIRGTEVVIEVSGDQTTVTLLEGAAECMNEFGSVQLNPGEQSVTRKGSAPTKQIIVNPRDAVQWALAYPLMFQAGDFKGSAGTHGTQIERALRAYEAGDREAAFKELGAVPAPRPAGISLLESNLALASGETDRAEALLLEAESAVNQLPAGEQRSVRAQIDALRAVTAVVQNRGDDARRLAQSAVSLDGSSPAVTLANAYVSQSSFDLEATTAWLEKTIESSPHNPYPYARRAEIALGAGDVDLAEEYLARGRAIDPEDLSVLTVTGFLHLTRNEIPEAKALFEAVIARDATQALPHLGLGLAIIQTGNLEGGRQELERAAFLEPSTAIYRSYLGKAYFEEEREGMAGNEYDRAIALDPRDPTPHLYRAYNNLSQNNVIGALNDVERSIELNNNRAVYRSSLLLDQDTGVRSAGLSEVFTALGFNQAARVEAIKSLNRDYSNYSAHRLLGDSYGTIETDDASRTERALAEILAPVSFNLFQNPGGEASLNDYNALFNRDETRVRAGLEAGTQDDQIDPDVALAGKQGPLGYFLGFDSENRDGSRHNNYLRFYRGRGLVQYQPTFEDRFILGGETFYRRNVQNNEVYDDVKLEEYSFDATYVRRIAADSKLFAQVLFQNLRDNFKNSRAETDATILEQIGGEEFALPDFFLLDQFNRERIKSIRGTIQHIFDSDLVSVVSGTQVYGGRKDRDETSPVIDDQGGYLTGLDHTYQSSGNNDVTSYDLYSYTTWHLMPWVDLTLGATFTDVELEDQEFAPFENSTFTRSQLSPKYGVTVYPTDDLTVRAAYFETLRKSSIEDNLTLEPTLVGGINQRLTDLPGVSARNIGVGADYKIGGSTYFGAEGLHRNLDETLRFAQPEVIIDYDQGTISNGITRFENEDSHTKDEALRAYVYQVLGERVVGSLDYLYSSAERFSEPEADNAQLQKIATTLRYFDPTGWFVFGTTTWREQNRVNNAFIEDGTDNFWLLDAGVGYRIPERHGSVVLQLNNILDEDFVYDQTYGIEEPVYSGISALMVASFNY